MFNTQLAKTDVKMASSEVSLAPGPNLESSSWLGKTPTTMEEHSEAKQIHWRLHICRRSIWQATAKHYRIYSEILGNA